MLSTGQIEEAEILAVLGQRIRPQKEPKDLAQAFVRLAGYWLNLENHARAIARYHRHNTAIRHG